MNVVCLVCFIIISSHQSLNREGRWGTTDNFATSFLHFPLFSTAFWNLANSKPVYFLMLSSHLFPLSAFSSSLFNCALQDCLGRHDHTTAVCVSYGGQEVFVWSDCLLDLGTDFLIGNMVFV